MRIAGAIAWAVTLAGAAAAAPAFARDQAPNPPCPEMPVSNDHSQSREGGLSLSLGGFGASGTRGRTTTSNDVMIRNGWTFEEWSAANELAHACAINRRLYPNDFERQKFEFSRTRAHLLGREPPAARPAYAARPQFQPGDANRGDSRIGGAVGGGSTRQGVSQSRRGDSETRGWSFTELWKSLPPVSMPLRAAMAGIGAGTADVDCKLSRSDGLSDCRVLAESPAGYGLAGAAVQHLLRLELTRDVAQSDWKDRRLRLTVKIGGQD